MFFFDRMYLANYSHEAFNAATRAGTLAWGFLLGFITLANMAEIFVAQYNGSKQYKRLGQPVWQMIYLAIGTTVVFFPIAWASGLFMEPLAADYLRWTLYFGPAQVMLSALSAFFIGQGRTGIIRTISFVGNGVNIILDPLFIFGIPGFFPEMGIIGAAIATGIGVLVQVGILAYYIFKPKNVEEYGALDSKFRPNLLMRCLRVGAPPALFVTLELFAWSIFYWMMQQISASHILVASVTHSIFGLFIFFGLGLEKGAAAVAGNLIGAKRPDEVKTLINSGLLMIGIYGVICSILFVLTPDFFISVFKAESVRSTLYFAMGMLVLHLLFENVRWLLNGVLTAAGDTLFTMVSGVLSVWLLMIVPVYLFVMKPGAPIQKAFYIFVIYSFLSMCLSYFRYKQGKWKLKQIIDDEEDSEIIPSTDGRARE